MSQQVYSADRPMPLSTRLERVAWAVMLASFFTFCTLVTLGGVALYQFLFVSTVPMDVTVQASRGSLGITGTDLREEVVQGARAFPIGGRVRPSDVDSQGEIVLRDPYRKGAFVASVTLNGSAAVASLGSAERQRFSWGTTGYTVDLEGVSGRLEFLVANDLAHGITLELMTANRVRLVMNSPGRYRIEVRDGEVLVESDGGPVVLLPPDDLPALTITSTSSYTVATNDLRAVSPPNELVVNGDFSAVAEASSPDLPSLPTGWACSHTNADPSAPRGVFTVRDVDGRRALTLSRGGGVQSNGETICQQGAQMGEVWQDISAYDSLVIQTTFYIERQSLAACGYLGSECPLMLRLDYLRRDPTSGDLVRGELVYGFYTLPDFSGAYPSTCPSCRLSHVRVQPATWFTFDSGNILAGFSADERPLAVSRVRLYASGHEYDVKVSRMVVLAE
jgi:hypothetical protein